MRHVGSSRESRPGPTSSIHMDGEHRHVSAPDHANKQHRQDTHHWLMVGEKRLLHKWELLRTQGVEDLNELRKLGQKRREHWSTSVTLYDRATP